MTGPYCEDDNKVSETVRRDEQTSGAGAPESMGPASPRCLPGGPYSAISSPYCLPQDVGPTGIYAQDEGPYDIYGYGAPYSPYICYDAEASTGCEAAVPGAEPLRVIHVGQSLVRVGGIETSLKGLNRY